MLTDPIPLAQADRLNWPTLSVAESRDVDRIAITQFGIPGIDLMRRAGAACAQRLLRVPADSSSEFLILAGAGNNAGDGYVIAQHLAAAERRVTVASLVPLNKLSGDALQSYQDALAGGVTTVLTNAEEIRQRIEAHDGVIVDCLLGTGSQGPPRPPFAAAIRAANARLSQRSKGIWGVAIDLPSGLDGDTGEASEATFRADLTLTFVAPKTGMRNPQSQQFTGQIEIVEIGIPAELRRQLGIPG